MGFLWSHLCHLYCTYSSLVSSLLLYVSLLCIVFSVDGTFYSTYIVLFTISLHKAYIASIRETTREKKIVSRYIYYKPKDINLSLREIKLLYHNYYFIDRGSH